MYFKVLTLSALLCFLPAQSFAHPDRILIMGITLKPAHAQIIPIAGKALAKYLNENNLQAEFSQSIDEIKFNHLSQYAEIILLDASEGIFSRDQKKQIEAFHQSGGGLLAIHASIALGNDWPWFKNLVGTSFKNHPEIHSERVTLKLPRHASAINEDLSWTQDDEWYEFSNPLDSSFTLVASVNENPVSWSKNDKVSGKFWYTAMGHSERLYLEPNSSFRKHLLGAVKWVLK